MLVVGFFTPKPFGTPRTWEEVQPVLDRWGVTFPIAFDTEWKTLKSYWLDSGDRDATSASFLIDRKGVIRWLHPGPELHPGGGEGHEECRRRYADLEKAVRMALEEK